MQPYPGAFSVPVCIEMALYFVHAIVRENPNRLLNTSSLQICNATNLVAIPNEVFA